MKLPKVDKKEKLEQILKVMEGIPSVKADDGQPYLSVDWVKKHIYYPAYLPTMYCPGCFKNNLKQNNETWNPYCDCG
jgi:hypothetical protein